MNRRLGLFTVVIMLIITPAMAEDDGYALIISQDPGQGIEVCHDCYANIITQDDYQTIDTVRIGLGENWVAVGNEGLAPGSLPSSSQIVGTGTVSDPYVIDHLRLNGLPGNGILVSDTYSPLLITDCTLENLGRKNPQSHPVGIGVRRSRNVRIENCTARSGELFRVAASQNVQVKHNKGRNIFFEGVSDGLIENCTADCIMIKGTMSELYDNSSFGRLLNATNYTVPDLPEKLKEDSQRCSIKGCNRIKEIDLFDARDCLVDNCSVQSVGLWIMNARNVTFRNSKVENSTLSIDWSAGINFENTTLINSDLSLAGTKPENYAISMRNCTVDGRPVYYYENQSGMEIKNLDAGHIWLVNCPGSRLDGVDATGIFVINSDGVAIENSRIDKAGITLASSQNCVISNNRLVNQRSENEFAQHAVCQNNKAFGNVIIRE